MNIPRTTIKSVLLRSATASSLSSHCKMLQNAANRASSGFNGQVRFASASFEHQQQEQDKPFVARWSKETVFAPSFGGGSRPSVFIDNGSRACQLLVEPSDTSGRLCIWEERQPPGAGVPIHAHLSEDEFFLFLEGSFKVVVGRDVIDVKAGDTAFVPRGTPHGFCNVGDTPGRIQFGFSPSKKAHRLITDFGEEMLSQTEEVLRETYDIAFLTDYFLTPESQELKTGWTKPFQNP